MSDQPKKMGRPTKYSEELAEEICKAVASNTCGLPRICEKYSHFPDPTTIREWRLKYTEFSIKYAKAKADQVDFLVEEALEVARTDNRDTIIDDDGMAKCDHEWIGRSRLHVDTIKWYASKLAPKLYGDAQRIDDAESQNAQLRKEVMELRAELDAKNKKEY